MKKFVRIRHAWPIIGICSFYIYLIFHAFNGSQGVMRWVDYENNMSHLQTKLEGLQNHRRGLEQEADQLRASHLSRDALDEKARKQVFVSHPNELTIWLDQTP